MSHVKITEVLCLRNHKPVKVTTPRDLIFVEGAVQTAQQIRYEDINRIIPK
jgi:hypothetical protein